jgi:chromosome segregation ATPase
MTDENKEINENDNQNGGNDVNEVEKLKAEYDKQLESLKKELSTRDAAINKINKEKQEKELANKTAEEQLEEFKKQVKSFEQKEAFRQSFKDVGLNPDDFQEIVNETDPKVQALKFSELLKAQTAKSAEVALEEFKKKQLENVTPEPKPKDELQDDAFTQGLKKGLGG